MLEQGLGPAASRFKLCAQDLCFTGGPSQHTGEVTAEMLKDAGFSTVIVGHSDKRLHPHTPESPRLVGLKAAHAASAGLHVIACVGETKEEREAGKGSHVVSKQLAALAMEVTHWERVLVAYEPIWAIGTGVAASLEDVQDMHESIRSWLAQHVAPVVATSVPILYGGSVSLANCESLAGLPDVDGFLIGSASLRFVHMTACSTESEFAEIVHRSVAAHVRVDHAKHGHVHTPPPA